MEGIIPVVATLLGGLLGFLASTITNRQNNQFQTESEKRLFKRQKKEELYYIVAKLKKEYRGYMGSCLLKVNNGAAFKIENDKDINLWEKLSMVINLYFPDLKDSVNRLLDIKDNKVGKVIGESLTSQNLSKKQSQDLNAKILFSFQYIEKEFEKLHDEVAVIEV